MPNDWDKAKPQIRVLYIEQRKTLDVVITAMEGQGFYASGRTYKNKFAEWGWYKNRERKRKRQGNWGGLAAQEHVLNPGFGSPTDIWWHPFGPLSATEVSMNDSTPPPSTIPEIEIPDSDGRTALHRAVISGELKAVDDLLCLGAVIDAVDGQGNQPLHLAAAAISTGVIALLLKRGADVNARGPSEQRPLHLALRSVKAVKALLKAHPALEAQDDRGDTPLHLAVRPQILGYCFQNTVVSKLIQAGANVNIPNRDGLTPFHTLLMPRRPAKYPVEDIIMCLHNGADVLTPTRDAVLPFQLFLNNCDEFFPAVEHVTVFLDKGADYNTHHTKSGLTLLERLLATINGEPNLRTKACEGVRINMLSRGGNSPLHLVAQAHWIFDAPTNIKTLLHRGFAPNAVNNAGYSPLWHMLLGNRFCETAVQALLDGGACTMQRNSTGNLPLYLIARKNAPYPKKMASKALLDSYLQHGNFIDGQTGPSEDEFWWHSYRNLLSCGTWSAVTRPPVPAPGMPADIATDLPKMMLAIAAERLLHRIKNEYSATEKGPDILQRPNVEGLRDHTVRILKDCSLLKLDIDVSWYHFMLDLMP